MSKIDRTKPNAVFIPDPNRWALIVMDWSSVFDVLGWRYDPTTDTSTPVVATRKYGCRSYAESPPIMGDPYTRLVPVWPGIKFGTGSGLDMIEGAPDHVLTETDRRVLRKNAGQERQSAS